MNWSKIERDVEQELHYSKLAAKFPKWAATNKTYTGWRNEGRQVLRGERSKAYEVTVCVGTCVNALTGEDEPRYSRRTVNCFRVDQTAPR